MFIIIAIPRKILLRLFLLMKSLSILSLTFCLFVLRVNGQDNAAGSRKNNLQVTPLALLSLVDKDKGAAVGFRYERLLSNKWSATISGGYYQNAGSGRYDPTVTSRQGFSVRPSLVYYLRNKEKTNRNFRGFYTGGAFTYSQDTFRYVRRFNGETDNQTQHFALIGGIIGYQQVIRKRFSLGLEINGGSGYSANQQTTYGSAYPGGFGYFYWDASLRAGYIF